jgi:predicted O-methyltransferase YrrM
MKNFEPHKDKIVFYKETSDTCVHKFQDEQFDYIFIDGDHSYEGVKKDLNNYYSKVKKDGVFSGHDINLSSVQQAIKEFREQNLITNPISFTDVNVWYWVK